MLREDVSDNQIKGDIKLLRLIIVNLISSVQTPQYLTEYCTVRLSAISCNLVRVTKGPEVRRSSQAGNRKRGLVSSLPAFIPGLCLR